MEKRQWKCEEDNGTLLETIEQLSKKVIMWQKNYNKAANKIEEISGDKQLKVKIESIDDTILDTMYGEYGY